MFLMLQGHRCEFNFVILDSGFEFRGFNFEGFPDLIVVLYEFVDSVFKVFV